MNDPITVKAIQPASVPEASAEGRPQLLVMGGNEPGRVITFEGDCVIGRSPDCELCFDDPGISRRHATIHRVRRNTYRVKDLDSSNGTRIDGELAKEREITSGATIQLGRNTTLRFLIQDPMERELEEATKLEFVSRLATGLSHDFNNLICAITSNIGYLRGLPAGTTLGHADVRDCLLDLAASGEQAVNLVRHLAAITKSSALGHVRSQFSEVLARAADFIRRGVPRSVKVRTRIQPGLELMGDNGCLEQLILAPCFNARDAMPHGGTLDLSAELVTREARGTTKRWIVVTIADDGAGMPPEVKTRAFEPLFSTKPGARGLGLSTTRKIAQDHGGRVTLKSTAGKGTIVTIELPALDSNADDEARVTLSTSEPAGVVTKSRVLIADDETAVARALSRVLTRAGYEVTLARDGVEALEAYLAAPAKFDVVLLDVDMPRMSGPECFARLRAADPQVRVVLMSGLWHRDPGLAGEFASAHAFLHKPVESQVLERTIATLLAQQPQAPKPD